MSTIIAATGVYVMLTEEQKMLASQLYDSRDRTLSSQRHITQKYLHHLNNLTPDATKERVKIYTKLFGHYGKSVWIETPFLCDYGKHIYLGNHVFINYNCTFLDCNRIDIGNNVMIGPSTHIYTATHPTKANCRIKYTKDKPYFLNQALPVCIKDNVWIGGSVIILPGVTIGKDTTIGAGAVVTKDIPKKVVAAGNPCRVIRDIS